MYNEDLTLKNPQGLIYHKTKPNQTNQLWDVFQSKKNIAYQIKNIPYKIKNTFIYYI